MWKIVEYGILRSINKLEQAWKALQELPEGEQDIAAAAILDFATRDRESKLSEEQIAEVKRRLADPNPKYLTLEEVRARFVKIGV